jgi:hypothetical protein
MEKVILGLVLGITITTILFYNGYNASPILKWDWDLKEVDKNCLYFKIKETSNSLIYKKLVCIKNGF